ncbi:unnamed protein product [Microthlaspi erraticum]|uniref:Retrotransposon Copia-like N-terminal domain-containing protein n=1 Tax=Microthlaspi erraticum TaxID=1685480 RepID=A0A6D2KYT0_9BRAS|nr:unnamed protein product [Microthlaspi erraticum]
MAEAQDPFPFPSNLHVTSSVTIKLNDSNYLLWKTQFESLLRSQKLLGFVTGQTPPPPATVLITVNNEQVHQPNPVFEAWQCTDQLILSWLFGILTEEVLGYVHVLSTSHEVWMALADNFNLFLESLICVDVYINSLLKPVDESMKIFTFLNGLGREYDPISTVIQSSMSRFPPPTFNDVVSDVSGFDHRLQSYDVSTDVSPHMAFQTQRFGPSQRGRGGSYSRFGNSRGRGSGFSTRGREQAKPETKDVVPTRNAVPSSSSSSPDTQLQTVVSEADIQKTASPKPETKDDVPKRKEVPSSSSSSSPDSQLQTVVPRVVYIQKVASLNPVTQPVQSISRPVTGRNLLWNQAAPVKKLVWKPVSGRSPSSCQASSSRDIQLQTMVPRDDIQKTASPKLEAQHVQSMSRPVSTPIIPREQAAPLISVVQTSTPSFARSMSSAGRLGSPPHSQTYIPKSYEHPIVGSPGFNHSSSQPKATSSLPPYSHPPPISVSSQSCFPINVSSWDLSYCGLLWTGGSSSNRDTTTTITGNHRTDLYNTPVTTSTQPTNNVQFGKAANLGISGRSKSHSEESMPHFSFYSYWQMDELAQTQRQMANMDMSLLAMRNQDDFSYFSFGSSSNPELHGPFRAGTCQVNQLMRVIEKMVRNRIVSFRYVEKPNLRDLLRGLELTTLFGSSIGLCLSV